MARATECLITVRDAIRIRGPLSQAEISNVFRCPVCKKLVKPLQESETNAAHFEHIKRNLDCPLSEKSRAKRLVAQDKAKRAKIRAQKRTA
jgi:rubredoxin